MIPTVLHLLSSVLCPLSPALWQIGFVLYAWPSGVCRFPANGGTDSRARAAGRRAPHGFAGQPGPTICAPGQIGFVFRIGSICIVSHNPFFQPHLSQIRAIGNWLCFAQSPSGGPSRPAGPRPFSGARVKLASFCTIGHPEFIAFQPTARLIVEPALLRRVPGTPVCRWPQSAKLPARRAGILLGAEGPAGSTIRYLLFTARHFIVV